MKDGDMYMDTYENIVLKIQVKNKKWRKKYVKSAKKKM